jgi:glyoxylase-like metal-dependent hydrolase (beta-lactamase superfamily II)
MRARNRWVVAAAVVALAGLMGGGTAAQLQHGGLAGAGTIPGIDPDARIKVLPVRGNLFLLTGAGANIVASIGQDGVLLVDAGAEEMSGEVLATVRAVQRFVDARLATLAPPVTFAAETRNSVVETRRALTPPKPIRYIITTSVAPDHRGGSAGLAAAGATFTGGNVAGQLGDAAEGAAIFAHENVQIRLSALQPPLPTRALPTDTYYGAMSKMSTFFNGEGVVLRHYPQAATDGDTLVHFRGADVIAAGDLYLTTTYPVINVAAGGTINGVIEALNSILDLSVAEFRSEGGTLVIPGHGRISDTADVAYYRDMTTILRDRIQDLARRGLTLEQVKAAKPTADYDGRYGATTGPWTTAMFIEAVYQTVPRGADTSTQDGPSRRAK